MKLDSSSFEDFLKAFEALPDGDRKAALDLAKAETGHMKWVPNIGAQTLAYETLADETFFGGAAGGGKSSLLCGLAVNEHRISHIFRRESTQVRGIIDELTKIIGTTDGLNQQSGVWRLSDGRVIEIAGIKDEKDKEKWQGRAADLKAFDEITHFTESMYRYVIGWNRSTTPGQRCRVICTGNPPTTEAGLWVIKYWGAWIDPTHPNPARPGELRWYTTIDGQDVECPDGKPVSIGGRMVTPRSRTFIPAKLEDNPDLMRTNYASVLEAMPEELRVRLRDGLFTASLRDQAWQAIPTQWIIAAQERWKPDGWKDFVMTAIGFDPAGGGADAAELSRRHGPWFDHLVTVKGVETADGSAAAATIIKHRRDNCAVIVDVGGGYGGAVTLRLKDNSIPFIPFNGANKTGQKTKDRQLGFANARAEAYWRLREALDPDQPGGSPICLPPDPELRSDLAAPTYEVSQRGILLESKEDLRERLGRSPGKGDAVAYALFGGDVAVKRGLNGGHSERPKYSNVAYSAVKKRRRGL